VTSDTTQRGRGQTQHSSAAPTHTIKYEKQHWRTSNTRHAGMHEQRTHERTLHTAEPAAAAAPRRPLYTIAHNVLVQLATGSSRNQLAPTAYSATA
jgi:hypothetical protein